MEKKPFVRQKEKPRTQYSGIDPTLNQDAAKKRGHVTGYCSYCKTITEWQEVQSVVAPKNAPVASPVETQVAWECLECGKRDFF